MSAARTTGALSWRARLVGLALLLVAALAGWRVVGAILADQALDAGQWRAAQAWRPGHPGVLLAQAREAVAGGEAELAAASARELLHQAPLAGEGHAVLADVADAAGRREEAAREYALAVRRAPRDAAAQAWVVRNAFTAGDYVAGMRQVDVMLRLAPSQRQALLPALAALAAEPPLAAAIADTLRGQPPWRAQMLQALVQAPGPAAGLVMASLHQRGGLQGEEFRQWIEWLMQGGRWGEAYAYWAGRARLNGRELPLAYNGDFAHVPTESGFDWRRRPTPGATTGFVPDRGRSGWAAELTFTGRATPQAELELPLYLAPGRYRLAFRLRADALRGERGLAWQVTCRESGAPVFSGEPIHGSFAWTGRVEAFEIPGKDCEGQWLRLVNPMPAGRAQILAGRLWVDDVRILPAAG